MGVLNAPIVLIVVTGKAQSGVAVGEIFLWGCPW
jgi:hypothetical protein